MKKSLILTITALICCVATTNFTAAQSTGSGGALSNHFSNSKYSIDYPSTWEVCIDEEYAVDVLSFGLVDDSADDYDFAPNINVMKRSNKRQEPTYELAKLGFEELRSGLKYFGGQDLRFIKQTDDIIISSMLGSMIEYEVTFGEFRVCQQQYYIKKSDNTLYIITLSWGKTKPGKKNELIRILNTLRIK